MFSLRKPLQIAFGTLCLAVVAVSPAQTGHKSITAELLKEMSIEQKLGATVAKDVPFRDETGKQVQFGDVLRGRPVLLLPIYYHCTSGCALITDGLLKTLAKGTKYQHLVVGKDLDVVMLSIDPKETPKDAAKKKALIMDAYAQPTAAPHWRMLTGSLSDIRKVTDSLGVHYGYNEQYDLIFHPTCSIILTPSGTISSYTIGNSFPTKILEDDLALAAQNKIGEKADQSHMFGCIVIDPITQQSTKWVTQLIQAGGILTLIVLVGSIVKMSLSSKRTVNGGLTKGA